jgi:hypothetical protein
MPSVSTVETYLAGLSEQQRGIASKLRQLILKVVPDAKESIKWGRPVYEKNALMCYIAEANNHITLGFYYGAYFNDPENLLQGEGKQLRHLKIREEQPVDENTLTRFIKESARIDSSR